MKDFKPQFDSNLIERLRHKYFDIYGKKLFLKKGDILLKKDDINNKLFLINNGLIAGYYIDGLNMKHEMFRSASNMFAGVHSFFSDNNIVYLDVEVIEDCNIVYIERSLFKDLNKASFTDDFVPLIVHELNLRQQFSRILMQEKEAALKKLYQSDKLTSLGQIAAGLAHELNNTSGIINGNINWLKNQLSNYYTIYENDDVLKAFNKGLNDGQCINTSEVRKQKEKLEFENGISSVLAKKISKMGIAKFTKNCTDFCTNEIDNLYNFWQTGVAIHDIIIAAEHSSHILNSIKQLSVSNQQRCDIDVNVSIHEALTLLQKKTASLTLVLNLKSNQLIYANKGEMVQVWVNLIKNACESLEISHSSKPTIEISSYSDNEVVSVEITDNGVGISNEIMDKIFQPNFTTKIEGLSFGLGLGLPIVQSIIDNYEGYIEIINNNNKTTFIIKLPVK